MAKAPADLRSLARSHTDTAIRTLASIMVDKHAPAAARAVCANSLLDRGWGKAITTSVSFSAGDINQLSDQELLTRLVELRGQASQPIDNVQH